MIEKQERTALIKALSDTVRDYAAKTEAKLMKWCSDELQALSDLFDQRIKELPVPTNGRDGRDGVDGSVIVVGDGPPLTTGKAGDIYLDSKTGDLYRAS